MSILKLSTTQKNKLLLFCRLFFYIIDKTTNDQIYWKCKFVRILKCKDQIHTNSNKTIILQEYNNHNHLGHAVSSEVGSFEENIRDHGINYNESIQTVIDNCLNNSSDDTVAHIPKFKHINFHTYWIMSFCIYEFFLYLFLCLYNYSICVTLFC